MSYFDLHPHEFQTLRTQEDLIIFDTRDADSYARGHLDAAQPLTDAAIKQLIKGRRFATPLLVYCYRGNSSRDICNLLAGFGFTRVHNLVGGWRAWERLGKAVSGSAWPAPVAAAG